MASSGAKLPSWYDRTWRRIRRDWLAEHPVCECESCVQSATPDKAEHVHHLRPRRRYLMHLKYSSAPGGADHPSNLSSRSHSHHSREKGDKA